MAAEDASTLSLKEYARKQRRADCQVCQLPTEIREEIKGASKRKITRNTVREWLHEVHAIELDDEAMTVHYSGHHD